MLTQGVKCYHTESDLGEFPVPLRIHWAAPAAPQCHFGISKTFLLRVPTSP